MDELKPVLTHTRHGADGINIVHSRLRFDLKTCDQRLVGSPHIRVDVDTMSDARERRALPSKPLWREFRVSDNILRFFGCVDLRNYNAAGEDISSDHAGAWARSHTGHQHLRLF